jgi:hypothetical protein
MLRCAPSFPVFRWGWLIAAYFYAHSSGLPRLACELFTKPSHFLNFLQVCQLLQRPGRIFLLVSDLPVDPFIF